MNFEEWVKEELGIESRKIEHLSPEEQKEVEFTVSVDAIIKLWNAGVEDGLKGKENEFKYFSNSFKKKIAELKAQIEEMKCCANCEYYSMEYLPYFCIKRQTPTHCTGLCDKWEVRK